MEMKSNKLIAVVGLGYVGLPLAILAAKKGFCTLGIDIDQKKIDSLSQGKSYIVDVTNYDVKNTKARFSMDVSLAREADAVIICVPTPVNSDKTPNMKPLMSAIGLIGKYIKKGSLLVIESTVNPGVCDEMITPLVERVSGNKVGDGILLAHCPERVNPGDPRWNVGNINRVIGADSEKALKEAVTLYQGIIEAEIKPMGSLKEAEAVKVVENSFRDVNIAFVNELAMSFHKLGINLENVIDGAATKPFAFMAHRPGTGVGGHCIPVDPYYLIEYAHSYGFEHDFLKLARNINEGMPQFTLGLLAEALNELNLSIKGTKILLLGLSYKPDVGDSRESPAFTIKMLLEDAGAELTTFDPYFENESSVTTLEEAISDITAVVLATGHSEFKDIELDVLRSNGVKVVIDGRNIYRHKARDFSSKGIIYKGIGVE